MKKFNVSILGILGILVLVVFASGCTSNTTSSNNSVNATFNNSVISFQYPKDLQVKNTSSDPADGAIIITNNKNANNGILVTSQDKATYEANIAPDSTWTVVGTYKSPGGVSYRVANSTDINGVMLTDYEFTKNSKYYEILGTPSDIDLMDALVDSVN